MCIHCKSLWIKASAKRLNVNVMYYVKPSIEDLYGFISTEEDHVDQQSLFFFKKGFVCFWGDCSVERVFVF